VIAKRNAASHYPEQLFQKQWMQENCEKIATLVNKFWKNPQYSNKNLESHFAIYKKIMNCRYEAGDISFEPLFWKKSEMLDSKNFSEYVKKYKHLPII
jgi:hypothetical protein